MKFGNTTPILRSFDEIKAKEFYLEFLEFNLDWEHRFEDDLPLYMQVSKDGCVLHITEHHGDCSPGAALRIQVTNLEQYHDLLLGKNINMLGLKYKKCLGVVRICRLLIHLVTD
ncbi:glyoxalase family protein [Moritella sp. PE36]|nr:glyoxalase family protein [Moritella sp. PE36]